MLLWLGSRGLLRLLCRGCKGLLILLYLGSRGSVCCRVESDKRTRSLHTGRRWCSIRRDRRIRRNLIDRQHGVLLRGLGRGVPSRMGWVVPSRVGHVAVHIVMEGQSTIQCTLALLQFGIGHVRERERVERHLHVIDDPAQKLASTRPRKMARDRSERDKKHPGSHSLFSDVLNVVMACMRATKQFKHAMQQENGQSRLSVKGISQSHGGHVQSKRSVFSASTHGLRQR